MVTPKIFSPWLRSSLMHQVGGISGDDIYANIIKIFDKFHERGYLLTMNYSKAFDCLDSSLSCQLLQAHGWPSLLTDLLAAIWDKRERFDQWDHRTHPTTVDASRVQPQTDRWGPLLMSLWVQSGVRTFLGSCEKSSS